MTRTTSRFLAVAAGATLAACTDGRSELPDDDALRAGRAASPQVQRATGLSHLPEPDIPAMDRSLARHYPAHLAGIRPQTSVLVDVILDERGFVRDVLVVDRPSPQGSEMILLQDVPGSNQAVEYEYRPVYDPAFGPAARAALKEVRFRPAIRAGKPVPYVLRMTVEFTSPA